MKKSGFTNSKFPHASIENNSFKKKKSYMQWYAWELVFSKFVVNIISTKLSGKDLYFVIRYGNPKLQKATQRVRLSWWCSLRVLTKVEKRKTMSGS